MLNTQLTAEQRRELLKLKNQANTHRKVRERVEMVLLSDAGWEHSRIAAHLGRGHSTVQHQVRAFVTKGMESLGVAYGPRGGYKANAEYQRVLESKLQEDRIWTAPQLRDVLNEETGRHLSVDHLRIVIKRLGYSWKRTKKSVAHSRKPEVYEARKTELRALEKKGG